MKTTQMIGAAAFLVLGASAAPTDYTPPGGFESIKYPAGTGENLHEYPAPPGGWENVKYPPGTGAGATPGAPANCPPATGGAAPNFFTSTYTLTATPDQVVNASNAFTGGLSGAQGVYKFGIDSVSDIICHEITLTGFRGEYSSPAFTATHIHEAARGRNGPPRITFPNPVGSGETRVSRGCQKGPFRTNVTANGQDSGTGFTLKQIEANPSGFFADVHSSLAVPGAVRGQLA